MHLTRFDDEHCLRGLSFFDDQLAFFLLQWRQPARDSQQELYYEGNSDGALRQRVWSIAAELAYDQFIPQERHALIDDHVPFAQRGVPAIDIIDFDYPYWHTVEDTCDKVGAESLESVGRVLEALLIDVEWEGGAS